MVPFTNVYVGPVQNGSLSVRQLVNIDWLFDVPMETLILEEGIMLLKKQIRD